MCFVALSHPIWVLRNGRAGKGLQRDRRWPEHGMLKSPVSKGREGCAGQPRTLHLWPHLWLGWHICVANTALFCAVSASGLGLAVSSELCPVLSPCVALAQGTGAGTVLWDELRCRWTPKGASTTHSHGLSSSHHATEVHFQISTRAEPPRCKAQVFQQASKVLLARIPWGWTHLSRAPVGSLPCVPCAVSGPSNSPENVVKKGLGEAALRAWDRPLAQERRGQWCLGQKCLQNSLLHESMAETWQSLGISSRWICTAQLTPGCPSGISQGFSHHVPLHLPWRGCPGWETRAGRGWTNPVSFPGVSREPWLLELLERPCLWCLCALICYFLSWFPVDPFPPVLPPFSTAANISSPPLNTLLSLKLPDWIASLG